MSSTYDPTSFAALLSTLTLPSDGDLRNVASVNGPFKALANAVKYLTLHAVTLNLALDQVGPAPGGAAILGNITAPAGSVAALIIGHGSGGGGGKGGINAVGAAVVTTGGGGGSGARRAFNIVPVTAGQLYDYRVAGSTPAENEGETTYFAVHASTVLFRAQGGRRGGRGGARQLFEYYNSASGVDQRALYAATVAGGVGINAYNHTTPSPEWVAQSPYPYNFKQPSESEGGWGLSSMLANDPIGGEGAPYAHYNLKTFLGTGGFSLEGFSGGAPGNPGADEFGGVHGGGVGGGGGGGAGGNGGDGGSGSAGKNLPADLAAASNGGDAPAGSGGGGGGGGGTGSTGSSNSVAASAGGRGGSGRLTVWFLGPAA